MTNIGVQSIPAFDFYMAPGILKTFKKQFKQIVYDYLELTDFDKFIAINGIEREIEKIPNELIQKLNNYEFKYVFGKDCSFGIFSFFNKST